MSGLFGGAPKSSPVQSTTVNPPAFATPFLKDIAGQAGDAYKKFLASGYNKPYAGDRTAGQNSYDITATNTANNAAQNFLGVPQNTFDLGAFFGDKVKNGMYTSMPQQDVQGAIRAATNPILQNFNESVIPQLKSSAIDAGAWGGSKSSELQSRAIRDTQKQLADTASTIAYGDIAQQRSLMPQLQQNELNAANTSTNLNNTGLNQELQTADIFSNLGEKERGFEQSDINDAINYWNELTSSPFAGLGEYAGLVQGAAGQYGSKTTSGYQPGGQSFLQGLGMLPGLSGLASSAGAGLSGLFQAGGMLGPAASFIGPSALPAGVGTIASALSFLSDIRVKENLKQEGSYKGLKVYSYNYSWDKSTRHLGVIAQDVLKIFPQAVEKVLGLFAVNYKILSEA